MAELRHWASTSSNWLTAVLTTTLSTSRLTLTSRLAAVVEMTRSTWQPV